jgi:hypothetical protein
MHNSKSRRWISICLLVGSFTFAFLLGEAIHELGHYLAHLAYGNADIGIHIDPFGGSRIVGVTSLPLHVMGVTSAAGPLFNLALAISCLLLLWRRRSPALLPLLLWGPVAMAQEGVNFSLGLLTPGGDAGWIVEWGVPMIVVLAAGVALLLASVATMSQLISLADLGKGEPFRTRLAGVMIGISSLMLVRAAHSLLASPSAIVENFVPLIFSLLLTILVVVLQRPVASFLKLGIEDCRATWPAATMAIILGAGMFVFQLLV